MSDRDRAYYLEHRVEILARQRERRAANPGPRRAYQREYSKRPGVRERANQRRRLDPGTARYHRSWVAANRERDAARKAAWYQANRDRELQRARDRNAADPSRATARARAWEQAQPMRAAANHAAKSANRRAEMYGAQGRLSGQDVLELWRREPQCVDCGDGFGLDHVIALARGGSNTTGNLANRCRSCNSRKGARERQAVAA
jgi:5-methylcytosine-specific restriction endonuclease McrA